MFRVVATTIIDNGQLIKPENIFPKLSRPPGIIKFIGRKIGADNDEIFKQRLGMKIDEIKKLKEEGII